MPDEFCKKPFDSSSRYLYLVGVHIGHEHGTTVPQDYGWWNVVIDTWDHTVVRITAEDPYLSHAFGRQIDVAIAENTPTWDCACRDLRRFLATDHLRRGRFASSHHTYRNDCLVSASEAEQYARGLTP